MRLPRFRFTVRRLMVAVADLGLLIGAEVTRRRWKHNLLMANYHANEERRMRLLLSGGWITETVEAGKSQKLRIGRNIEREPVQRRLMYHVVMGDRYQRAARRPWLAVTLDPPEPK
jgi:ribosomal protein L28